MAKKKKSSGGMSACMPPMPSPKQQIKYAAEHVARTAVENHPAMKRLRDEITRSVEAAVSKSAKKLGGAKKLSV